MGLVTEGPTNSLVLKRLLKECMLVEKSEVEIEFVDLQPITDQTSASPQGGWTMFYKWCLNNTPEIRAAQNFGQGLFAGDLDGGVCDVLLFQMDADACEKIAAKSSVIPVPSDADTGGIRGKFIEKTLMTWVWPTGTTPDSRHVVVASVEAIETWLYAGLEVVQNAEEEKEVAMKLAQAWRIHKGLGSLKVRKPIPKKTKNYNEVLDVVSRNIKNIRSSCRHFDIMVTKLSIMVT